MVEFDYNTIIAGLAISIIGLGVERFWSYFRKKHDVVLKSSFDILKLFDDYSDLHKTVDDNSKSQQEISALTKEQLVKLNILMKEVAKTQRAYSKLLNVLYKHDTQIKILGNKTNTDLSVHQGMNSLFNDEDVEEPS